MRRPLPVRSFETRVAGIALHGVALGEGNGHETPTFVLVHGLGMSGRYMMPTAHLLAASGRVFVPDLPGFGRSGKPPTVLTIPQLADALADWMTANGIVTPVMIGNSLGGQIIVDFAVRHPHRLVGAVLVGPTIDAAAPDIITQVFRLMVDISREPPGLCWIGLSDYFRAGFRRVLGTLRHALADPVLEKLPHIRVPVLVTRGDRDPLAPQPWVERVASLIPESELRVFPRAAHAVNFDDPEALAAAVLKFVNDRIAERMTSRR